MLTPSGKVNAYVNFDYAKQKNADGSAAIWTGIAGAAKRSLPAIEGRTAEGEQIECEGLILRAERVARRRIGRVRIERLVPKEIHHDELGNLSVGAPADVTVLRVERGAFGFTDMYGARMDGDRRLAAELTLRDGKVVYDLNGITRPQWTTLPKNYNRTGDSAWDTITPATRKR